MKKRDIKVKRGDIIWLKKEMLFELLGKSVQDLERPYLVISNNKNNDKAPTINIVSLSKQLKKANYPMHVLLEKAKYNGLKKDSVVLVEQIKTIEKIYVKEKVGSLDKEDINKLNKAIFIQFIDDKLEAEIV